MTAHERHDREVRRLHGARADLLRAQQERLDNDPDARLRLRLKQWFDGQVQRDIEEAHADHEYAGVPREGCRLCGSRRATDNDPEDSQNGSGGRL